MIVMLEKGRRDCHGRLAARKLDGLIDAIDKKDGYHFVMVMLAMYIIEHKQITEDVRE